MALQFLHPGSPVGTVSFIKFSFDVKFDFSLNQPVFESVSPRIMRFTLLILYGLRCCSVVTLLGMKSMPRDLQDQLRRGRETGAHFLEYFATIAAAKIDMFLSLWSKKFPWNKAAYTEVFEKKVRHVEYEANLYRDQKLFVD